MDKRPSYVARLQALLVLIALIWAAHFVNVAMDGALARAFALSPRRIDGLDGVLGMPFVHFDLQHLIGNTPPLAALGALLIALHPTRFWPATLIAALGGGALLWLFGRDGPHLGASGLIFGWFGYLAAAGALERSGRALLGAAAAIALYGGALIGGLAPATGVSVEAHAFGLAAGVAAAFLLSARGRRSKAIRRPRAR